MPIAIAIRWLERRSPRLMQPHSMPIGSAAAPERRRRRPCARMANRVSSSTKNYVKGIFLCHLICWARRDGYVTCVERKRTQSFAAVDVSIAEVAATSAAGGKLFVIAFAVVNLVTRRYRVSISCFRRIYISTCSQCRCVQFVDSASKPLPATPTRLCPVKRSW